MPHEGSGRVSKQFRVKKRTPNACNRCRQQKIKCSGTLPCEQCNKRRLACSFEDKDRRVLVSKAYIEALQQKVDGVASVPRNDDRVQSPTAADHDQGTTIESDRDNDSRTGSYNIVDEITGGPSMASPEINTSYSPQIEDDLSSTRTSPEPRLCNPLSGNKESYISDSTGKLWYLGSSSNWSFTRRVLSMAHERAYDAPLPANDTSFDGNIYSIGWDGLRSPFTPESTALPSSDYAIYLINAVKFHCGQMFHLFDEQSFMLKFTQFHQTSHDEQTNRSDLWFIHYLLILAFGKAFIVRSNAAHSPPGADLFVWALKRLPDTTFLCAQSVESVEVLCCVALYLQSLDYRCSAYNFIGQALRLALALGMHTSMDNQGLDDHFVQRCRSAWWTVYVLDRQMSSLMGVPLGVRDEDVRAVLPTFSGSSQRTLALEIHVKLSRIISQILNTVYGRDGRLSRKYLNCTKAALKNIAAVTDELNRHFGISHSNSMAGISRLSAYLHLLYHQCVLLATRPLFFSCFKMRLDNPEHMPLQSLRSSSAKILLQMCLESANQILNVLLGLQQHSLLESFLPFDLEAAFAASLIVTLAPAVDPSLSESPLNSLNTVYQCMDEMVFRGNMVAATRKAELRLLEDLLNRINFSAVALPTVKNSNTFVHGLARPAHSHIERIFADAHDPEQSSAAVLPGLDFSATDYWSHDLNSEQLFAIADSLNLDGIDWITMSDTNIESNTGE